MKERKKRIHTVDTDDEKMKNTNFKFIKTLEKFFFNRPKTIFKNKKIAKIFILFLQ